MCPRRLEDNGMHSILTGIKEGPSDTGQ
jgi:hypothetical protein